MKTFDGHSNYVEFQYRSMEFTDQVILSVIYSKCIKSPTVLRLCNQQITLA